MQPRFRTTVLVFIAVLIATLALQAQRGRAARDYDPASVATVRGTVTEVTQHTGKAGWPGTHATVKTETGLIEVHLGPTSYLAEQGLKLTTGDEVEVTGSRRQLEGKDALIAREVKLGVQVFVLRNPDGVPLWSRGRRR